MNKFNLKYCEQKLTEQEILDFETQFEIRLPENLKTLLMVFNGGVQDRSFKYNGIFNEYAFSSLRPIKYGINTLEIAIDDLQITEQHIPREEIPFADDSFGNLFTFSTRNDDYGRIYFWAMDVGEPRREPAANSLEDFFGVESFEEL